MTSSSRGEVGIVGLFVEILNKCVPPPLPRRVRSPLRRYLYFFEKGCSAITPEVLQGLLQLITDESGGNAGRFYASTIAHIKSQKAAGGDVGALYESVTL